MVEGIIKAKLEHDAAVAYKGRRIGQKSQPFDNLLRTMDKNNELVWKRFVGLQ